MTITERAIGGTTVLDVEGRLTMEDGAERLSDKIRSLLQQDRKRILVNMGGVISMDSTGLGELVQGYVTATRQGGAIKLLNTTKRLHDLLVITKLSLVFESFDSEAAGVASFGSTV